MRLFFILRFDVTSKQFLRLPETIVRECLHIYFNFCIIIIICRSWGRTEPLPPRLRTPQSSRALVHWTATPQRWSSPRPHLPETSCPVWTPNAKGRTSIHSPPIQARKARTARRRARSPAACYSWPNPRRRRTRRRRREKASRARLQVECRSSSYHICFNFQHQIQTDTFYFNP